MIRISGLPMRILYHPYFPMATDKRFSWAIWVWSVTISSWESYVARKRSTIIRSWSITTMKSASHILDTSSANPGQMQIGSLKFWIISSSVTASYGSHGGWQPPLTISQYCIMNWLHREVFLLRELPINGTLVYQEYRTHPAVIRTVMLMMRGRLGEQTPSQKFISSKRWKMRLEILSISSNVPMHPAMWIWNASRNTSLTYIGDPTLKA